MEEVGVTPEEAETELPISALQLLAQLPVLLNSSLDTRQVIQRAIKHAQLSVGAGAATVFIKDPRANVLTFWAAGGDVSDELKDLKMPSDEGIVGWVVGKQESVWVKDAETDERFFSEIDSESGFKTKDLICVPLIVRGAECFGALQVLNSSTESGFPPFSVRFLEQFGHQLALAIQNARLFEELKNQHKMIQTLERRKNEMITVISHEFKTPLGIIQSSADMLGSGMLKEPETQQRIADAMISGVQRLTGLIQQIDSLALPQGRVVNPNRSSVPIAPICQQVIEAIKLGASVRELEFELKIGDGVGNVDCDQALIIVVLQSLLSNAVRFTPDGGTISLNISQSAGMVTFEVRDTGIGIAPEEHDLIFEKFYEVGDALVHSSGVYEFKSAGLGLGLAVVRRILEAHGANCEVISALEAGSCFRFLLPVGD